MRDEYESVRKAVEKYTKKGYRVLVFGKYNSRLIKDGDDAGEKELTAKVIPLGIVVLQNNIRDTAPETFKYFAEQGVQVKVISGDDPETVSEVAKKAGIVGAEKFINATKLGSGTNFKKQVLENTVIGRVSPNQKRRIVKILQEAGRTVAMVGDGINDSPALAAADVSVSMKHSSDIAREVADISLLSDDLYDLVTLRKLSTGMLDKINTNYRNIVAVNGSLLVLGVLGVIPPSTSSMIHNLSTMLFGALSTKSVLSNEDYSKGMEVEAIEVADIS